jgi:hypothetical protein
MTTTSFIKPKCQVTPLHKTLGIQQHSLQLQKRSFSLWNIPMTLMAASPLKRRIALVGLGGVGLAITVILGPFLLIGVGGIAAVIGWRAWRFKRQIQHELERQTSSNLNDWPDFLSAFIKQQQQGSFFGQDQRELQKEALHIVNEWVDSSQGRRFLDNYGIPYNLTQNVSMRGSYSSTNNNSLSEIKIELELLNSPGSVLIAKAVKSNNQQQFDINEVKLATFNGQVVKIPLSNQNKNGGRIIEGEFKDVA